MIKNKKIMMITTTDNMIWQFMLPHIKHLQQQGNTVECVCAKTGFWFDELQTKHNLKVHEINFERSPLSFKNLKGYKQLKKLQKQEKFDLVYCQQPVGGLMGRLIAKKFKLPCIYTAHGFHFFKGNSKIKNFIFRTVEKYLSKYTDILITINEEDYQNALKFKAKKVFKIDGIGYDSSKYEDTKSRQQIRTELGLTNEFVIVTIAEFIKRKNYNTMLQAIEKLKDKNIKFLICGTGRDKKEIENQIKELKIEDKVQLLGYRKDVNNVLLASDLFMLASFQEGLTLSVMEAMSFGLPCVVSNVRGNQDLIKNDRNGFVCEVEDSTAFANKIEELLTNTQLYNTIKQNNLTDSKKYTIQNVIAELDKIYKELN